MQVLDRPAETIFQPSDLNKRGRTIIDAARESYARLRDKDGVSLIILKEESLQTLETISKTLKNYIPLEHSLLHGSGKPEISDFGDWSWLRVFDQDDLADFLHEIREALMLSTTEGTTEYVDDALNAWRTTAEALDDPTRREILLGDISDDDFTEVDRPE